MRIIFLDVDGVLNTYRTRERSYQGMVGIDPKRVQVLKEMQEATGAVIVLTSTWRNEWDKDYEKCRPDGRYLADCLSKGGICVHDKVPGLSTLHRGEEIRQYVKTHPCSAFIVLDDEKFPDFTLNGIRDSGPKANWIHTQFYSDQGGLQPKHVERAVQMMERQEKIKA